MGILYYAEVLTLLDLDPDPYSDGFSKGYSTNFRDGSLSQGQVFIPILLHFNQVIRVRIGINGKFLHGTVIRVRVEIRVRIQQCE